MKRRLTGLSWPKPWPWIFVVVTVPVSAPFLIWRAMNRWLLKREKDKRRREALERRRKTEEIWHRQERIREALRQKQEMELRDHGSSNLSRFTWREIRGQRRMEGWILRKEHYQAEVEEYRDKLHELGRKIQEVIECQSELRRVGFEIKAVQDKLTEALVKLKEIEQNLPIGLPDETDNHIYDSEFNRLREESGIRFLRVSSQLVEILTNPVIFSLNGDKYDLGDYLIKIPTNPDNSISVRCIYSTAKPPMDSFGHIYGNGSAFCFGSRREMIRKLRLQGEYLPITLLVLEAVYHVNEQDLSRIVHIYPRIDDYGDV